MKAIHSMTGFATATALVGDTSVHLDLRSVNSRFLDLNFRLPDELRPAEPGLREQLNAALSRGKVDCRLNYSYAGQARPAINRDALRTLQSLAAAVRSELPDTQPLSTGEILRWPGMLGDSGPDFAACLAAIPRLAAGVIDELTASRAREGEQLAAMLRERLAGMRTVIARCEPCIPAAHAAFEARLRQRLIDALGSADDERIRQELVVFAARVDVSEELSRLKTHLEEVERVLATGGSAGKRLDFLMQELNREANTLGSKSVGGEVSAAAMELKLLIEQMREQVQNIE